MEQCLSLVQQAQMMIDYVQSYKVLVNFINPNRIVSVIVASRSNDE